MKKRFCFVVMIPLMAFIAGCGSDSSPSGGGGGDSTPPGVGSVTALDANHVQVTFSEAVDKATAEHSGNYVILETTPSQTSGALAPGDTTHVGSASLAGDGKTVTVATQESMQSLPYEMKVTGVKDLNGNKITTEVSANFAGSAAQDVTPPQIVQRTPGPGATNVGIGTSVVIQFDEPMAGGSVESAFQWTWPGGIVSWQADQQSGTTYAFTSQQPLLNNTTYVVSVTGTATDFAGNPLAGAPINWSFTTTATQDNTPPTLVSSVPSNNMTNVPVSSNLSLTFSEPINQNLLMGISVTPDVGNGVESWSNGGRTLTFDPDVNMLPNTQYSLTILPGGFYDLAGNPNAAPYQVVWSTGTNFNTGQFSGVISGHPGTPTANPAGAIVIAADMNPFGSNDDFGVAGLTTVMVGGGYSVTKLPNGWFFPVSAKDSNGDGQIDPDLGDAIGAYGVVLGVDNDPDSIQITGGSVTGINFALYDPMAITGSVSYTGSNTGSYNFFVGVFDTTGLDVNNLPDPDFGTAGFWPFNTTYRIGELDVGLAPGTYYVGAYLDVDFSGTFDPATDPAGLYGGLSPTPITLGVGEDALNINITMQDAAALRASMPTSWKRASPVDPGVRESAQWMRRELARQK